MTIFASPSRVCAEHGLEFWTGLVAYTNARSGPCVRDRELCGCVLCEERAASFRRESALASHGPSPADHADFGIRLAS